MSSLSDVHERLRGEWAVLESQWQATRSQWSDGVGDRFEKEFWEEMEEGMPRFLRELRQVDNTLTEALKALNS